MEIFTHRLSIFSRIKLNHNLLIFWYKYALSVLKYRTCSKFKQPSMLFKITCSTMSPHSPHLLHCREFQSIFIYFHISSFTTFNISSAAVYILEESTCKCTHWTFPAFHNYQQGLQEQDWWMTEYTTTANMADSWECPYRHW